MAGTAERVLALKLIGDVSDINKAMKGTTSRFKQMSLEGKKWTKAFTGGLILDGIHQVGDALGEAFGKLKTENRLLAQTNAVLKSTGRTAGVSSKFVVDFADALEKMSGIESTTIQDSENLLLTFRNIKGQRMFQDATKAALDLSVALGKDLHSSSIMVGKALNDPIKGLTALGRAGVQFSDAQKKVITDLVKTGHVAKAQRIILAELQKQVGGSAKAFGSTLEGRLAKIHDSFINIGSVLLRNVLPAFGQLIGVISDLATGNVSGAQKGLHDLLFGYDKLAKGHRGLNDLSKAPIHVPGLVDDAKSIGDTIISGIKDAFDKASEIDFASILTFDNLATQFRTAIQLLQTNKDVLGTVGIAAGAIGLAFAGAMFVLDLFTTAAGLVFAAPAWLLLTTGKGAVAVLGRVLGYALSGALFDADAFALAARVAIDGLAGTKGWDAIINAAKGTGALIGGAMQLGFLAGFSLLLSDLIKRIVGSVTIPGENHPIPLFGSDLPHHASGTSSARGGWSVTGERGPELVNLRRGSTVLDAQKSMAAMSGGGGSITVNINGLITDPVATGREVARVLAQYNRRSGGVAAR